MHLHFVYWLFSTIPVCFVRLKGIIDSGSVSGPWLYWESLSTSPSLGTLPSLLVITWPYDYPQASAVAGFSESHSVLLYLIFSPTAPLIPWILLTFTSTQGGSPVPVLKS